MGNVSHHYRLNGACQENLETIPVQFQSTFKLTRDLVSNQTISESMLNVSSEQYSRTV